ncbi:MAG: hypothetical protein FWE42_02180 [Defluviitaleaceae bacterium]|nr:hypothetical protein [Defluviitaleaceae bacterium]
MNNPGNHISIIPMSNYKPPCLPSLQSAQSNPKMLKKLPKRWRKNAAVITCIGIISGLTLVGCTRPHHGGAVGSPLYVTRNTEQEIVELPIDYWPHNCGEGGAPYYVTYPTEQELSSNQGASDVYCNSTSTPIQETPEQLAARLMEANLESQIHHGGSGAGPFYVVHITEQEVFGFIQAKLETAGLNLSATPPSYTVNNWWEPIGIDLYDAQLGIAVTHLSWEESHRPFSHWGSQLTTNINKALAEQMGDVPIGVFYNPGETIGVGRWEQDGDAWESVMDEPTQAEREEARKRLIKNLNAQVLAFIHLLQGEGIIP